MIKAKGDNFILFGLSDENIKRLQLGHPIQFNLKELGMDSMTVFIIHGETEESMAAELKQIHARCVN
jgi:hypothetical protein